jgi:hypothetical protein
MSRILIQLATHSAALLLYPGLVIIALFGSAAESVWIRITERRWVLPEIPWHRPSAVLTTVALASMLASVQLAAPFNLVPSEERNLIVAAISLGIIVWAELALGAELFGEPGLLLLVQCCWLVAVLGPAVEPQSLPALLKLWPMPVPGERRATRRLDALRVLSWWPYCGLFATLYFPPSADDVLGIMRFIGLTVLVAAICVFAGALMRRRGAETARGIYRKGIAPFAGLVLALVIVTSLLVR